MIEGTTNLESLLRERLEDLSLRLKEIRARKEALDAEAKQLESDMNAISDALRVETRGRDQTTTKPRANGDRFLGVSLIDAMRLLREENPGITKISVKRKLKEGGFDFRGKRPGSAIHMTWTNLEKQKHKSGEA